MTTSRLVYGVTIDQSDELDRLIRTIAANGDVIMTGGAAELNEQSLPALGAVIYDAACAVRSILDQLDEQRLRQTKGNERGRG